MDERSLAARTEEPDRVELSSHAKKRPWTQKSQPIYIPVLKLSPSFRDSTSAMNFEGERATPSLCDICAAGSSSLRLKIQFSEQGKQQNDGGIDIPSNFDL